MHLGPCDLQKGLALGVGLESYFFWILDNQTVLPQICFHMPNTSPHHHHSSLSIRRFWGKGERWKRKRERAEGEKRLTQMLLLEPSTPTQHDSISSNQNHFRSLGCQLHVSKSSPKINLTLRSGRAPVLVLLRFRFFLKPLMRRFRIRVFEELYMF